MDLGRRMVEIGLLYNSPTSFSRFPLQRDLQGASVGILGVPYDLGTVNRPGARFGPRAIREMSIYGGKLLQFGFPVWPWDHNPLHDHKVIDYGDISYRVGSHDSMLGEVQEHITHFVKEGVLPLTLGGDHSISLPILRGLARGKQLSLIHFDSHPDTLPMTPKNHASVFYDAVHEGLLDPTKSVQLGIRSIYLSEPPFHILDVNKTLEMGPEGVVSFIRNIVGKNPAYLTFDIDFLDPAFAPGTGTPEIGGPNTHFARRVLQGLYGLNFVGADLVEISPPYDTNGQITAIAGAQLAVDLLYLLCGARKHL